MAFQIDRMTSEIDVTPGVAAPDAAGDRTAAAKASALTRAELKELLRPIFLELLAEGIEDHARSRG